MSIPLHPEKGVNPRMTACRKCGKDVGVALIGRNDSKFMCGTCGTVNYGSRHCIPCDGQRMPYGGPRTPGKVEKIGEFEKFYIELCDECADNEKRDNDVVVNKGGICWKCDGCKSGGVVVAESPLCQGVREKHGPAFLTGPPYKVCGVTFETCPACDDNFYDKPKELHSPIQEG